MRHVISRLRVCRRRRLRAAYRERDVRQYAYGHRRGAPVPVALVNVIGHLIVSNTTTVFPFVHEASCGPRLYPGIDIMARSKTARRLGTTLWSENNTYPQMPGVSRHDMPKRHRTWHTMGHMSDNTTQRKALQQLESEPSEERIAYYRKPFMVLWAAIQEASSELQDDYTLSPELSQLWVGEQIRQVSDSLVDRLAEIAVAHGESKSNVARAANASPDNVIRRFPRLKADAAHDRTLIDDVLDSLE